MDSKTPSNSQVQLARHMFPEHANPAGNVHGGTIMKIIDNAALIAAMRHTHQNCVTASVDQIDFISPVYVGNLVLANASKSTLPMDFHVPQQGWTGLLLEAVV